MFAAKDRLQQGAAASCRPATLAAFPLATSSEFSPAESTPEQRKVNALCFDILTDSFCRKPPVLIFIQFARGVYPLNFKSFISNELQTAPTHTGVAGVGCTCSPRKQSVRAVLAARQKLDGTCAG
jgi:hypothetical protein